MKNPKNLKNLSYLLRHKYYVWKAGLIVGAPKWRLVIHDWSKLTPIEWVAYREAFYGVAPYQFVENFGGIKAVYLGDGAKEKWLDWTGLRFKRAWLHHQHLNPHHWQHWCLLDDGGRRTALDMPEALVREMVADWVGAGFVINGKVEVQEWYAANKQHMILSTKTRELVERLIQMFPSGMSL